MVSINTSDLTLLLVKKLNFLRGKLHFMQLDVVLN